MSSGPRFPAWLLRADPLLHAAETNAVYQAFRLRRVEHDFPLHDRARLLMGSRAAARVVMVLVFAYSLVTFNRYLVPIAGAMIAGWILLNRFLVAGKDTHKLPRSCAALVTRNEYHAQPLFDLWMTGAKGYDMAEAAYLEIREADCVISRAVIPLFLLSLLAFHAVIAPLLHPCGALFALGAAWLVWQAHRTGLSVSPHFTSRRMIRWRMRRWRRKLGMRRAVGQGAFVLLRVLSVMAFMASLFAVGVLDFVVLDKLNVLYSRANGIAGTIFINRNSLVMTMDVILVGTIFLVIRLLVRPMNQDRLRRVLEYAGEVYEGLAARVAGEEEQA
ncbi:hypothetical protein HZA57_02850 [Candidatus Poribacteria bacterium]|nr:hypothetical protein [Candidatus Poribacteria bacterium]